MTAIAKVRAEDPESELLAAMVIFWPASPWEPLATPDQRAVVQQWSDELQVNIVPGCVLTAADAQREIIDATVLANCVHDACARKAEQGGPDNKPPRGVAVGLKSNLHLGIYEGYASASSIGHLLVTKIQDVASLLGREVTDPSIGLQVQVLLYPGVL